MTNEDHLKTSPGAWLEIFRNNLQGQEGKELFRKTKIVPKNKIYKLYPFTALQKSSQIYFLALR